MTSVVGGGVDVAGRPDRLAHGVRCRRERLRPGLVPDQAVLGDGGTDRRVRDAGQGDACVRDHAVLDQQLDCDRHHREVAVATGDLLEAVRAAGCRHRELDAGDDLVGFQGGGEHRQEEVGCADATSSAHALHGHEAVEREPDRAGLGRGVGVRECPADRPARADLLVGDVTDGVRQQRHLLTHDRRTLDRGLPGKCAERQASIVHRDGIELGQAVEIDQALGAREAHVHHRHEALAAGERLLLVAEACGQLERLGKLPRREVLERRGLHRRVILPAFRRVIKPRPAAALSGRSRRRSWRARRSDPWRCCWRRRACSRSGHRR